jgi:hypothetical protein
MAAALAESTCRSRRESDARKTMTRIAERQLRRLRRVRAGKFRSDLTAGDLAHPRNRSLHEIRRIRRTRRASMRRNGLRASIPAAVATIATSPRRHGAAEGERPGAARVGAAGALEWPPLHRSVAGHGHPHGCVPHVNSDESSDPRSGGEGRGRRGLARRGEWEPAGLRRGAGFQIFRFSPPRPPGPRWRPSGAARWGDDSGGFILRRTPYSEGHRPGS